MSLIGALPAAVINGSLSFLYYLDVSNNMLSQSLPSTVGSYFNVIYVHDNSFTGELPQFLNKAGSLVSFLANNNQFHGPLPFNNDLNPEVDFKSLSTFAVGYNQLTGVITSDIFKLEVLYILQLSANYLSKNIPESIADMPVLQTMLLDSNLLTGCIPTRGLSKNGRLLYLNLSTNLLSGTLPESMQKETLLGYLDLSNNRFQGSLGSLLQSMRSLEALIVFNNKLTGTLDGVLGDNYNPKLLQVDFGCNAFSGTLPLNFFEQPQLQLFVVNINCFTGSLSEDICHARNMTTLILDGLHSSEYCNKLTKFFPWQRQATYTLHDGLQGTVPRCIYALPQLETLHLSGNGLIDTLFADNGDGEVDEGLVLSNSLHDLSMSHNLLHGSIALSLLQHRWSNLDLSSNQLGGTLPYDAPVWAFTEQQDQGYNGSLKLSINRLSGDIPPAWQSLPDIDMLSGNLFACQADGQDLPVNDPNYRSYDCGSDLVNYSLITWGSFFAFGIAVLVSCFCCMSCFSDARKKSASFSSSSEKKRKRVNEKGSVLLWRRCRRWLAVFKGIDGQAASSFYGLPIDNLIELGVTLRRFAIMVAAVLFALLFLFLPVYAIFTHYFGTYEHQSAWMVSFSFLQGLIPAVVLFVALILLLVFVKRANVALVGNAARNEPTGEEQINLERGSIPRHSTMRLSPRESQTRLPLSTRA